jgi:hypothetical protein
METTLNFLRRVVTLDEATYRDFLTSENVMKRGFLILLACFLTAAIPVFGESLTGGLGRFSADEAATFQEQFQDIFSQFQLANGADAAQFEEFLDNFAFGMDIGVQIDALPTPLPRPIAVFFKAVGAWLTAALSGIRPWLGYGVFVLLFAKLAGGRGIINHFMGLTALFAVPHLLGIFSFIPFVGPALVLLGTIWGIAVYVRAVQVSQDFSGGKAFLITVLPALIVIALGICLGSVSLVGLISAVNSAQ